MSAHVARPVHISASRYIVVLVLIIPFGGTSFGESDIDILLKFKDSLQDKDALENWSPNINPCSWNYANWNGVLCSNASIWGLKLEHMGLKGLIDVDSLGSINSLRMMSVMNNRFEGPLPDIKKMGSLKSLYLSNNGFSGSIPDDAFEGMSMLKKLYLANNKLSGNIPSSLAALPKLMDLRLEANQFEGKIPDFKQNSLNMIDLSNNELEGNRNLCGQPLDACQQPSTSPKNESQPQPPLPPPAAENRQAEVSQENVYVLKIVIIVIVVAIVLALIAAAETKGLVHNPPPEVVEVPRKSDYGRLSFVRDDQQKFDLQDMLRSSAEVLGSGTFGASYKTGLYGRMYVVKRYKQMNKIGRDDFHEHMRRIGRLSHPNLLPLTAYYYRKEEKLLVYEFVENGSLANKLHAKQKTDQRGLDWPSRLKIIKGVVKGLSYLHSELHNPVLPYGHLKSSNVLLGKSFKPLLTDYTLRPVINPDSAHKYMLAYKSPEYTRSGRISKRSDVWSLGILILEVLTGKFPENYLLPQYDSDTSLSTWVNQMVKEKHLSEVFDTEMGEVKHNKSEMINLLKIGLSCCDEDAETRMSLKEAAEKIEEIRGKL
ncbi:hypothetical protein Patl1_35114 [Pistacia atlantica]|uniref:Uncharacterized protein n=1 Tax=Pistacia atlantica TaxID=434234 RepID=A0ACC0ZRX1_9ROSI|nr:hypothetical protein Patl1_35114 [Pistacia atlantica]